MAVRRGLVSIGCYPVTLQWICCVHRAGVAAGRRPARSHHSGRRSAWCRRSALRRTRGRPQRRTLCASRLLEAHGACSRRPGPGQGRVAPGTRGASPHRTHSCAGTAGCLTLPRTHCAPPARPPKHAPPAGRTPVCRGARAARAVRQRCRAAAAAAVGPHPRRPERLPYPAAARRRLVQPQHAGAPNYARARRHRHEHARGRGRARRGGGGGFSCGRRRQHV